MESNKKSLVAYYSRKGNNYIGGRIIDLPVGNTEVVTQKIQQLTGAELFEIKTIMNYPEDYTETTRVAQKELRENARPKLSAQLNNLNSYDIIYLGYPNWRGTMPMAVYTFLESADFSGKTILPFCTHGGSGLGSSIQDIKKLCPYAKLLEGLAITGSTVSRCDENLKNRIKNQNLI